MARSLGTAENLKGLQTCSGFPFQQDEFFILFFSGSKKKLGTIGKNSFQPKNTQKPSVAGFVRKHLGIHL